MMRLFQNILAAGNETDITRILIGAVFVLIWLAGQAMSVLAKRTEEARRRRLREQIGTPQQSTATVPHRPVQRSAPPAPVAKRIPQRLPKQTRTPAKAPPPLPSAKKGTVSTAAAIESIATVARRSTPIASPTSSERAPVSANATALRAWLQPKTLRQQFMLTEVFQPPLALRDPDQLR
jgi:hypothetical protein